MARPKGIVAGVGINDSCHDVDDCPYYNRWRAMLSRCYNKSSLTANPSYTGCSVCKDWLTFSNFKAWMEAQDWKGKELDKDILIKGNKVYSPEACVFVSNSLNTFVVSCKIKKNGMPVGVRVERRTGKYTAQVRNPFTGNAEHLGTFESKEEAVLSWISKKGYFACKLADMQSDDRIANALRSRYAP